MLNIKKKKKKPSTLTGMRNFISYKCIVLMTGATVTHTQKKKVQFAEDRTNLAFFYYFI